MYCVAYGVKGNTTTYTVNYVDANGKALYSPKTLIGNVGDKPVVAYLYIDGYQPNTHNLTKTLVADATSNVFTFTYTPIVNTVVTREDVTYVNNGTAMGTVDSGNTANTDTNTNAGNTNAENNGTAAGTEDPNETAAESSAAPQMNTIPVAASTPTPAPVVHEKPVVVEEPQTPLAVPEIVDLDPEESPSFFDIAEPQVPLAQLRIRADEGNQAAKNAILIRYCAIVLIVLICLGIALLFFLLFRKKNRNRELVMASDGGGFYSENGPRTVRRVREADNFDVSFRENDAIRRTAPSRKNSTPEYHSGPSFDDFDVEKLFNRKER